MTRPAPAPDDDSADMLADLRASGWGEEDLESVPALNALLDGGNAK